MEMKFIFRAVLKCGIVGVLLAGTPLHAKDFPNQPIRLVVPFSPGGGNDTLAREVAPRLSALLGQSVVVENKPGAGGNIGADYVAKSAGDGYTVLMASNQVVINPSLYADMSFDVLKDLKPIGLVADVQFALVRNDKITVNEVPELIQLSKTSNLHHGTPGMGTPQHLAAEVFNRMTGAALAHVPYRGTGPMIADLVGGQIELAFATLPSVDGFIKEGRLRALAVTGSNRSPLLPDVPTIEEAGVKGYSVSTWYGLLVPRSTPDEVSGRLESALREVMQQDEALKSIAAKGFEPKFVAASDADRIMKDDFQKWESAIKDAQITLD